MLSNGLSVTKIITGLDIAHRIEQMFPAAVEDALPEAATVTPAQLLDACSFLRDDPELKFEFLSSLTAVDRLEYFEVVYHLTSIRLNQMTAIKVKTTGRFAGRVPASASDVAPIHQNDLAGSKSAGTRGV